MEITVRVEVQYVAPEQAKMEHVLQMFRRPTWVRFMMRYISPRLKNVSPADKSVIQRLQSEWSVPNPEESIDCVICMTENVDPANDQVKLPCGHAFHHHCVSSWLQMRSTCPVCRYQLQKAFAGTYAVHSLTSTVVLSEEHQRMTREEILQLSVERQVVRAVVQATLIKVISAEKQAEYPCELSALLMHTNGEVFSDIDVGSDGTLLECQAEEETKAEDHAAAAGVQAINRGRRHQRDEETHLTSEEPMGSPTKRLRRV